MERAFIVTENSKYHKELDKYVELSNQQKEFINKYFDEKGIEALGYIISGTGGMNKPFEDWQKKNITLSIEPTDKDIAKFEKMLCTKNEYGLCKFKKSSAIAKDFAQRCIDEKVVINLWNPRVSDYFESISYKGCGFHRFIHQDIMYMKINSDYLDDKEVPKGFTEIKLSEFYAKLEEHKEEEPNK